MVFAADSRVALTSPTRYDDNCDAYWCLVSRSLVIVCTTVVSRHWRLT